MSAAIKVSRSHGVDGEPRRLELARNGPGPLRGASSRLGTGVPGSGRGGRGDRRDDRATARPLRPAPPRAGDPPQRAHLRGRRRRAGRRQRGGATARLAPCKRSRGRVRRSGPRVTYPPTLEVPAFTPVSSGAAGSTIQSASYYFRGPEGHWRLPRLPAAGFSSSTGRYPVLYLLPGNSQPDSAFLQVGPAGRTRPPDRQPRDRAPDRRDDPGRPGCQQLAQPGIAPLRELRDRSPATDRSDATDGAGTPTPRDRGRLDGRLRRDEHRPRLSLPLRHGRELARFLQRPRRRAARTVP